VIHRDCAYSYIKNEGGMGITIKGKNGGFEIAVSAQTTFSELKESLIKKLEKNKGFFAGTEAKIVFTGKEMSKARKHDLKRLLEMDYGLTDVTFGEDFSVPENSVSVKKAAEREEKNTSDKVQLISDNYFDSKSIFVAHTLRSGQRVECAGDVVVLGDVNIGAEVIAAGSVAVMGTLRGLVHAGATGRSDVVVAAGALLPGQLRISGKIAVFPEGKQDNGPEIAEFKQGSVVLRPMKAKRSRI